MRVVKKVTDTVQGSERGRARRVSMRPSYSHCLESGRFAMWLDSGRTPSMKFKPAESHGLWVSVHDGPSSGVTVTVPLFAPPGTWASEQRDLLARVREVFPREVIETSPGAYEWRRAGNA